MKKRNDNDKFFDVREQSYKDVPHYELVVENEAITVPSVFMFTDVGNLFAFLRVCEVKNCTVHFENEDLTVKPGNDTAMSLRLTVYMAIADNPKFVTDYIKYLSNEYKKQKEEGR